MRTAGLLLLLAAPSAVSAEPVPLERVKAWQQEYCPALRAVSDSAFQRFADNAVPERRDGDRYSWHATRRIGGDSYLARTPIPTLRSSSVESAQSPPVVAIGPDGAWQSSLVAEYVGDEMAEVYRIVLDETRSCLGEGWTERRVYDATADQRVLFERSREGVRVHVEVERYGTWRLFVNVVQERADER